MINRSAIKQRAKEALRAASPQVYLVTLLVMVLTMSVTLYINIRSGAGSPSQISSPSELAEWLGSYGFVPSNTVLSLVLLVFSMFSAVVSFGYSKYCLRLWRGQPAGVHTVFEGFQQFLKIIGLNLLISLLVFLWSLLLVIPGIIAAFAYSQAPRILMDDPDIGVLEAIRLSREIMRGHKGELFVLGLSFIGWMLLIGITFGIASVWVMPYMEATQAGFYDTIAHGGADTLPERRDGPEDWRESGF